MTVIIDGAYSGTYANTHARIAHAGNWETGGTVTASSTDTGYDADAPDNTLTYERWKPTSIIASWQYTFSGSTTFDYFCIGAHTLADNGCTFRIQHLDGGAWTNISDAITPTDNSPIFILMGSTTDTAVRMRITGGTPPTIGIMKVGQALEMPRPFYGGHVPLDMARVTEMRSTKSDTGEFLGRTKVRRMLSTQLSWQNLKADWVRSNWPTLQTAIEEEPFFIATRPSNTDFGAAGLCYVDELPAPQTSGQAQFMDVSMNVTGYLGA